MAENEASQDWRWMTLLGAPSPIAPADRAPLHARTADAPEAVGARTTRESDLMRATDNPPPAVNDLVWQWDEDDGHLSRFGLDAFRSSFAAPPSDRTQADVSACLETHLTSSHWNNLAIPRTFTKSTCARRKWEIAMLRAESEKLQERLLQVREHWTNRRSSGAMNCPHGATASTSIVEPNWKYIALWLKEAAQKAKNDNRALKAGVQDQRKKLKAFRKLFMKRSAGMANFPEQFRIVVAPNPLLVRAAHYSSFDALLDDSTLMFEECDKVRLLFPTQDAENAGWSCAYGGSNDLHLEIVDNFVVPFSRVETEQAIKRMHEAQPDAHRQIDELFESSDDTILRQFISSFNNLAGNGDVRVKQTVRRFVEGSMSVFVINKTIERLTGRGDSQYRSHLRERTWIMLSQDDRASGSSAMSIMVYSTMKPNKMRAAYKALWCEQRLQESVIPVLNDVYAALRSELEALLIKEGAKNNTAVGV